MNEGDPAAWTGVTVDAFLALIPASKLRFFRDRGDFPEDLEPTINDAIDNYDELRDQADTVLDAAGRIRNEWTEHLDYETLYSGQTNGGHKSLRKNLQNDESLGLENVTGWQAHHIIPWQLRNHALIKEIGIDLNNSQNGLALPCTSGGGRVLECP